MRIRSLELLDELERQTVALGFSGIKSVVNKYDLGVTSQTLWRWRRSDRRVNQGLYRKIMKRLTELQLDKKEIANIAS